MKKDYAEQHRGRERIEWAGADAEANRQLREELWEERLQALAGSFGHALDQLPKRKSAVPKVELAAAMKATTSVPNGWLAQRLGMGPAASVSQYVRRHRLAGGTTTRRFKAALSRVNT